MHCRPPAEPQRRGSAFRRLGTPARRLAAARDAKPAEDLRYVELHAIQADAELGGDRLVGEALSDESEHLLLTKCQDIGKRRSASSVHTLSLRYGGGDLHYP